MPLLQIVHSPEKKSWKKLLARPVMPSHDLTEAVMSMLKEIKEHGDQAVRKFAEQFDQISQADWTVSQTEIEQAKNEIDSELREAIDLAKRNIEAFHQQQTNNESVIEIQPGIRCWRKSVAIEKVGLYIPGGTAPLFSTLLMLGIPAVIAGCGEIIVCTPPQKNGSIHPAILFTAGLLGIKKIFKVGGVQAIGAMAYGTQTIPQVYKIFGPGNQWVTRAKSMVQQEGVAIDMPAGPSELAIYADENAIPEFVAADLLSQCEHGPDSQVIMVTTSNRFADRVNLELETQLEMLPRRSIALQALQNSSIFVMNDFHDSIELINEYAPEHLILACRDAEKKTDKIRNAGSVFLGHFSPESAGDYASGTNHTLPTNGYARAYSGVSVDSFVKKITFQELTREGLAGIGNAVVRMANAEGLAAHASAVDIRLNIKS